MKRIASLSLIVTVAALLALAGQSHVAHAQSQPFVYFVPPTNCTSTVSGNSTGTNGQTTVGASAVPVVQAQTSASGTNTHTYQCNIAPPANISGVTPLWKLVDAVFLYGVQTTALDTQVSTAASGTLNSSILFNYIQYPTSGASETASTVTPVRADAGTIVLNPVIASFNVGTSTAGAFYSQTFTPASPITWNTDLKQLFLKVTLQAQATSATITNSPGVFVHVSTY